MIPINFLWDSYAELHSQASNSYGGTTSYRRMLDVLILCGGFAAFCLFIAHERLRNRL